MNAPATRSSASLTQAHLRLTARSRVETATPESLAADFRAELADVLAHVLLVARHHDMNLEAEVERKWLCWTSSE